MSRMMACFELVKAEQPDLLKLVWHLQPLAAIEPWAPKQRYELQQTLIDVRHSFASFTVEADQDER